MALYQPELGPEKERALCLNGRPFAFVCERMQGAPGGHAESRLEFIMSRVALPTDATTGKLNVKQSLSQPLPELTEMGKRGIVFMRLCAFHSLMWSLPPNLNSNFAVFVESPYACYREAGWVVAREQNGQNRFCIL